MYLDLTSPEFVGTVPTLYYWEPEKILQEVSYAIWLLGKQYSLFSIDLICKNMSAMVIKEWPKYLNILGYNFIMLHTSRFKPAIPWRLSCPSYNACKPMAWCHWYPFRGSAWRCLMGCVVRMLEETWSWTGWGWHSADGAGPKGSKPHHLHGTSTWSDAETPIQKIATLFWIPTWRPHIANLSCFSFLVWRQRFQPGVDVPSFTWDVQGHMHVFFWGSKCVNDAFLVKVCL